MDSYSEKIEIKICILACTKVVHSFKLDSFHVVNEVCTMVASSPGRCDVSSCVVERTHNAE